MSPNSASRGKLRVAGAVYTIYGIYYILCTVAK